jgi:hypothetical protein
VYRAARAVAAGVGEVEHLLVHALAGDGGIAVDQHRQRLHLAFGAAPHLARIHRAGDDGVDDLEVRRVEGQGQVHRAARGADVGRVAHVVLDVAGRECRLLLAFEFVEQHRGKLAQGIDQHVEAAAVGHADHHFLHADRAGGADQLVHGEDQGFATLEREALLANIFRVQVALQRFGMGQLHQEALLVLRRVGRGRTDRFQLALQPALLADVRKVHEFGTDRAAEGLPAGFEHLAQGGFAGNCGEGAGLEYLAEVSLGKAVVRRLELRDRGPFAALERIELRPAIAEEAVGVDQLQHLDLLAVGSGGTRRSLQRAFLGALGKGGDDRIVGHVGPAVVAGTRQGSQLVEIVAPGRLDRRRVGEVGIVERLDVRRIRAEQIRVGQHLLHHCIT